MKLTNHTSLVSQLFWTWIQASLLTAAIGMVTVAYADLNLTPIIWWAIFIALYIGILAVKRSWWNKKAIVSIPKTAPVKQPEGQIRDERECPYCAENILKRARFCKHCGREVGPLPETTVVQETGRVGTK